MPWKQGYTISNEIGLRDDEVRWPDGNRCCVTVVVDLSVARGPERNSRQRSDASGRVLRRA